MRNEFNASSLWLYHGSPRESRSFIFFLLCSFVKSIDVTDIVTDDVSADLFIVIP